MPLLRRALLLRDFDLELEQKAAAVFGIVLEFLKRCWAGKWLPELYKHVQLGAHCFVRIVEDLIEHRSPNHALGKVRESRDKPPFRVPPDDPEIGEVVAPLSDIFPS